MKAGTTPSANSGTAGYFCGGYEGGVGSVDTVNKYAFSNDARTTLGTGLSAAKHGLGGMANSGTAGYVGGGDGPIDTVQKFAFSDDSRSTLTTGITTATYYLAGFANEGALV